MFENLDDPQKQALLMMAAGLLAPQDRRLGKGGQFAAALSQGMQGGLMGYNNASREKRRAEALAEEARIRKMQADQMQSENEKRGKIDALGAQYFQPAMTQDDPTSMKFGESTPGKQDFQGYAQALTGIDPMKGIGLQAQLQQLMAKNIQKYGKDDRAVDMSNPAAPKVIIDAAPDKPHWVDMGNAIAPFDNSGKQVGPAIPKNLAPGEAQRIGMEGQRLGMDKARLGMDVGRYNYEVGNGQGLPQKLVDSIRQDVGKKQAEAQVTAQQELPQVEAEAKQTIGLVDKLVNHPGFSTVVGSKGPTGIPAAAGYPIAGTDAADFIVLRNQLIGKQFLQAFQTLKGGGQITEVEGKKATDAIARMDTAQTEAAFREAAMEFRGVIEAGLARAKRKASTGGASGGWSIQRVN